MDIHHQDPHVVPHHEPHVPYHEPHIPHHEPHHEPHIPHHEPHVPHHEPHAPHHEGHVPHPKPPHDPYQHEHLAPYTPKHHEPYVKPPTHHLPKYEHAPHPPPGQLTNPLGHHPPPPQSYSHQSYTYHPEHYLASQGAVSHLPPKLKSFLPVGFHSIYNGPGVPPKYPPVPLGEPPSYPPRPWTLGLNKTEDKVKVDDIDKLRDALKKAGVGPGSSKKVYLVKEEDGETKVQITVPIDALFEGKRDLKGFKCMTVRLDVFGDTPRLFQYFVKDSNILRKIPTLCESFEYFVNHSNML